MKHVLKYLMITSCLIGSNNFLSSAHASESSYHGHHHLGLWKAISSLNRRIKSNAANIADNFSTITGNTADISDLQTRVTDLEEGTSQAGQTLVDVNCVDNPDALLVPPINGSFPDDTTYNLTGACNGPLHVTEDRVHFVGVDPYAAIVLPGSLEDPSNGAVFGDGAHDLRIKNLLIDASAWGTGAIANGTDAAGIYARNAFIRVENTTIRGGQWGINPFRNAIVRLEGEEVVIEDFVNSALSIGDQSLITARTLVIIKTGVTDGSFLSAVDVYRTGMMDFRAGVTVKVPPENEYTDFFPIAINVFGQSHLRIRSNESNNIRGAIMVDGQGFASINDANIGGDLDIGFDSAVTLNDVIIEGGISAENGSRLMLNSVNHTGDIEVSAGGILEMNESDQSEGTLAISGNSNATINDSSVEEIFSESASSFVVEGGQFGGAELFQGAIASFLGANAFGHIRLFAPSNIVYQQEDGEGSLNSNTIFLCGNTSSFVDDGIRATGPVVDTCLGNPYED